MFAFIKRLFKKEDHAQRLAFEKAQKIWQDTDGAVRQRHVAAMLLEFVRNGINRCVNEQTLVNIAKLEADIAQMVAMRTYHWRRVNLTLCPALRSEEFHVRVEIDFVYVGLMATPRYTIKESGSFTRLSRGQAMVEIHHREAPRYRMGISDWNRHGETCAIYAAELEKPPARQKEQP